MAISDHGIQLFSINPLIGRRDFGFFNSYIELISIYSFYFSFGLLQLPFRRMNLGMQLIDSVRTRALKPEGKHGVNEQHR